jgi:Zn-dependent peptidase ImmA (M78 family)
MLDLIEQKRLGGELQNARLQKGLRQEDVSIKLGIARTSLVAIEKGERKVKPDELIELAKFYGVSIHDLMRQRPASKAVSVQFRAARAVLEKDTDAIEKMKRDFEVLVRDSMELEHITHSPLIKRYPEEYPLTNLNNATVDMIAERIAGRERARLGLGDSPITTLRQILEEAVGIRVFSLPMTSPFSGLYMFIPETEEGCIGLNANHPPEKLLLTLAHEYCHFLTTRLVSIVEDDSYTGGKSIEEKLAERFAVHFIMPRQAILASYSDTVQEKGTFTVADMMLTAHYFGVSFQAMGLRLIELEKIKATALDALKESGFKIREQQKNLGISHDKTITEYLPTRYKTLALQSWNEGLITESQCAKFLRMDIIDLRMLADEYQDEAMISNVNLAESELFA